MNNYITSPKRPRLDPQSTMDLPPLPFQSTSSILHDDNQFRFLQSQAASTCSTAPIENDHLLSYLHHSDMDFDAYHLRVQNEKLLAGLKETWKRRTRGLLLAIRQQFMNQLIEKESQLEMAKRRNVELEHKLTQINAEMYVWFDMAKNSEAIAAALQTKLNQAISTVAEGSGGCDNHEAEDAQSSCVEGSADRADTVLRQRSVCGMCREKGASVLLLPCRHLILCKDCEPMTAACPLCCSVKNASLDINLV